VGGTPAGKMVPDDDDTSKWSTSSLDLAQTRVRCRRLMRSRRRAPRKEAELDAWSC
jgi:hypothetical protein